MGPKHRAGWFPHQPITKSSKKKDTFQEGEGELGKKAKILICEAARVHMVESLPTSSRLSLTCSPFLRRCIFLHWTGWEVTLLLAGAQATSLRRASQLTSGPCALEPALQQTPASPTLRRDRAQRWPTAQLDPGRAPPSGPADGPSPSRLLLSGQSHSSHTHLVLSLSSSQRGIKTIVSEK